MKTVLVLSVLASLSLGLAASAHAQASRGKPTKPGDDQKPGDFAGSNYDPSSGCVIYYVWTNVQPNGQLGKDGYRRRADDGKGYVCPMSLGWQ